MQDFLTANGKFSRAFSRVGGNDLFALLSVS
jgi:hypothetical protein